MGEKEDLQLLRNFIFNDEISQKIEKINSGFLEFNILEITGMGNQEIKHSNILAWLFGDNEHGLGNHFFIDFLKRIYVENGLDNIELQNYIYLSKKLDLTISREQNNIDLLVSDNKNKKVFAIENKVFSSEHGEQLAKYEKYINDNFSGYDKYFIYLTIDGSNASREGWLNAGYNMIATVIEQLLSVKELLTNTKLLLESYIDLLKRRGIVMSKEIQELCNSIWQNKEYSEALEILIKNKPNKLELVEKIIKNESLLSDAILEVKTNSGNYNFFVRFSEQSPLMYRIVYSTNSKGLTFLIVTKENSVDNIPEIKGKQVMEIELSEHSKFRTENRHSQFGYYVVTNYYKIDESDITEDYLKNLIEDFKKIDFDLREKDL